MFLALRHLRRSFKKTFIGGFPRYRTETFSSSGKRADHYARKPWKLKPWIQNRTDLNGNANRIHLLNMAVPVFLVLPYLQPIKARTVRHPSIWRNQMEFHQSSFALLARFGHATTIPLRLS